VTCTVVTTQAELDVALAGATFPCIHIKSEAGVWLNLSASGSATVRAYGSATVRAYGSATVRAYGSATVEAYGSATVEAYGSATVRASGSATVRAYGSATVEAYGSATVHAHGQSKVTAGSHVAVHLHSTQATITGGVLIDVTQLDLTDAATWCDHYGVDIQDGRAVLFKATDSELVAGRSHRATSYTVGTDVVAEDWRDDHECGGGLHLSPRPHQAAWYQDATVKRYLRCMVALEDLRPIDSGKAKARTCRVEAEVDVFAAAIAVRDWFAAGESASFVEDDTRHRRAAP